MAKEQDAHAVVAAKVREWQTWISEGRVGKVMQSIESLPSWMESEKAFLRIRMFHQAGLYGPALEAIETLEIDDGADPRALLTLACISADGGAALLAARLIYKAIELAASGEELEQALSTAQSVGDGDLEELAADRLRRVLPDSRVLKLKAVDDLVAAGDFGAAATALATEPDADEAKRLYQFLHSALGCESVLDYPTVFREMASWKGPWAAAGREAVIAHATHRGQVLLALELTSLRCAEKDRTRRDVTLLMDVVERMLLERQLPDKGEVLLRAAVVEIIRHLAGHPTDGRVRLRLARLLSPEVSGPLGLGLLGSITFEMMRASRPQQQSRRPQRHLSVSEFLGERRAWIEGALKWLASEAPVVLGRTVLPAELVPNDPDEVSEAVAESIEQLAPTIEDDGDVKALLTWLSLGVSVAPHTSSPDQGLVLMRLSAGVLANAGRVQQARDLVEGALQAAGESAGRRRLAWSAMADVYHRVGNNLESLIALAAAAAGETEVDAQEMWHETECLVRVLRDLGLYDLARQEHQNAETLLRQLGYWDANQHRHVLTALQVDMAQLVHGESRDAAELHRLMIDVAAVGREVLAREDDPTVPAVMLGQLIRFAHQDGVPAPPEADAVLQLLLQHAGTSAVELVRSASSQHVTAEDLLRVYQRTEPARYADDVAFDLRHAVLAARRLLNDDDAESDSVCLAIEVLADRAIAIPGWQATARPAAPIADIHSPAAAAKAFSMQGLSVVLAALDGDGRLVSVTATGGHLGDVRCESEALFSAGALRSWAEQFPRCYGIDDAANLFFTSTERLRLSALPPDPTLLVAEPDLQQIPPNLWRVNDEFAGLARPMAAAPSLSWLEAASNRSDTSGRKVAWISTESQHGQTLATLADRLRPTFVEHGIRFDTSAILPEGYAGADLVVVAAHGGLHAEGRFFQRVSDEGSLTVGSHEFARALRNIGVVILFVCSGGRLDRHPGANTTIGLVSQVLHQGCSAVVASPWPLDARVTYHWFPAFMRAWKDGAPLIDANFQANGAVGRAFGNDLAKCLAMNVYGDPLKRFTG